MIAALILAHQSPELVGRLVKRLESYGAECFVHIDAKVDIAPFQAACSGTRCIFIKPRTKVEWGGFSIVEATISLLTAALAEARFTHFVLMSGDTYPVKPRGKFRHLITRPFEQIGGFVIPPASEMYQRIARTYLPDTLVPFVPDGDHAKKKSSPVMRAFKMKKQQFPWRYSKGGQWWCLTAETAQKCLDIIARETELIRWFTYSLVPDEALFQTILENFGPFRIGAGMPVYTVWDSAYPSHPFVFSQSADFERLKKTISPLARKFSIGNGWPLLDLLDGWMDKYDDLAYCKPALSSSASPWSRHQDPKQDACGANGESLAWDFGFSTRWEREPWWMVDLLGEYIVEEVAIVNRLTQPQRFRSFTILSSENGRTWRTRFTQSAPIDVSTDPDSPLLVKFSVPFAARYVRIVLLGEGCLHLRRVQIFGRALAEPDHVRGSSMNEHDDLAYCKPAASSSASQWARHCDPRQDACGANGESLADDFGFFTEWEREPWWMVDLLSEYAVEELAIVNRVAQPQRFRTFSIFSSLDGKAWRTRFTQAIPIDVSSDPETPWRVQFANPFAARYVRITLLGDGCLHLRRVQIFGRASAACGNLSDDLAYCKPALSSSVSRWARHQDPRQDASGANGELMAEDFGFFTEWEHEPWWMIDLLGEYAIEEIAIVNRAAQSQRFRVFSILSSHDGRAWRTRFAQAVPIDVSSDRERPWRVQFTEPFAARYMRIALLGEGCLHLRRVQIFGHALACSSISGDLTVSDDRSAPNSPGAREQIDEQLDIASC